MKLSNTTRFRGMLPLGSVLFVFALFISSAIPDLALGKDTKETKDKDRAEIRKMAQDTLSRLYKVQPAARKAVEGSAGYAVFSNFGMKIFVGGSGSGKGVAINNKTKKDTFMKMFEVQAGLGMGIKKFRLVWVFENTKEFDAFVNSGWELGAQANASAKTGSQGAALAGAMAVAPGVWVYQMTDDGLALELTAKGTKYYKDDNLN
jgi:lipid-binding SYLF domain-containing protein